MIDRRLILNQLIYLILAKSTGIHKGVQLLESRNINTSLFTLMTVISKLAQMKGNETNKAANSHHHHIPYRNSKLTHLLKDSLGGNSKTIFITTISPADLNYSETLNSLLYADRAKNIVNRPTINEDPNGQLIRELRAEIANLKSMLERAELAETRTSRELVSHRQLMHTDVSQAQLFWFTMKIISNLALKLVIY